MTDDINWTDRAAALHDHGIPEKRAKVVALIAAGRTHAQVAEELGMSNRGEVSVHVTRYRNEDKANAEWLAANAPDI
jgi:FixJ family two-component response regulator